LTEYFLLTTDKKYLLNLRLVKNNKLFPLLYPFSKGNQKSSKQYNIINYSKIINPQIFRKIPALVVAYLLVSHGSSEPQPQIAAEQLAGLVQQQLEVRQQSLNPHRPLVGTAALECTPVPLHQQIQLFASQAIALGIKRLQILPLFLLPGVHLREDIPREIALAQQVIGKAVRLELQPHLGSNQGLPAVLSEKFAQLPARERILFAHGSRYPGANEAIEKLAHQLGATAAYWSVSPTLAEQVATFASQGRQNIAIFPYFLFSGGTVRAITRQVEELQTAFPSLQLYLGEPLGATPELARLIAEGVVK
jgi:sirohydrochlorin cobaltochelatase